MLATQTPPSPCAIGRITSRAIKNGSVTVRNTAITYVPGADGSKTALVASYQNGTDAAYSYTYDANGNITEITQGTASFTYEYDKANQLIRENLYYGSGNSNNATYTYEYDAWGNILNKKKYAYTTGTLGSVLNTKTYGYTNTQWGDLLTSYNGSTITYDAMGNMASYGSKTYSWEGKQLVGISLLGAANYTFAYDENGLRTSKTLTWVSDNTSVATEYYYNGSVLIGMKTGSTVMRFSYGASGNVVSVDYSEDNGANFTTYYYLRNAQNDIVKLIDGSGNTVVEYTYDSWGKPVSTTGSLSGTLGEDQPLRYRGYVYDSDTQLYYLQSRYYDPKICRFISADVLLSTGQGVLGHNSFAYCLNDPINNKDDTGAKTKGLGGKRKLYKLLFLYADITKTGFSIDLKSDPDAWDREFKKLGKKKAYRAMAEYLCDSYKAIYDSEFLLSEKCVANEIAFHANAYMWAIGKEGYSRNVTTVVLSIDSIIAHCERIDISTNDALKFRDPFLFQYPFHVRKQYLFTDKNPYFVRFKYSMRKVVIL